MRLHLLAITGLLLASAACYETPHPSCAFLCGTDSSCPSSYFCATDGWCKADGVADSFVCDPTLNDAATIDAPIVDAGTDADIDAPAIDAPDDAAIDAETDAPDDAAIDASVAALAITTGSPLSFGSVIETQTATRTVMVRNGGGSPTSAITVGVSGSATYAVVTGVSDTCSGQTLAPSTTCSFDVRYAPTGVGTANGVASAMATMGGSVSINLTGTSTAMLVASPSPLPFGTLSTGTMAALTVTVTNQGAVSSGSITTTAPTGAFTITTDTCAGSPLVAADTCDVTVQFAPTATGAQMSTFTLNATPGGPRTVTVTGTGQ